MRKDYKWFLAVLLKTLIYAGILVLVIMSFRYLP